MINQNSIEYSLAYKLADKLFGNQNVTDAKIICDVAMMLVGQGFSKEYSHKVAEQVFSDLFE